MGVTKRRLTIPDYKYKNLIEMSNLLLGLVKPYLVEGEKAAAGKAILPSNSHS